MSRSYSLNEAADMAVDLSGTMGARGALFHAAYVTKWSPTAIDARLARRFYDALADAGTHDAAEYESPLTEAEQGVAQ